MNSKAKGKQIKLSSSSLSTQSILTSVAIEQWNLCF